MSKTNDLFGAIFLILLFALMLIALVAFKQNSCSKVQRRKSRNGNIEFLRFIIIMGVVIHHYCGLAPHGYLGVDFFFILSGYFLMQQFMQKQDAKGSNAAQNAIQYTKQRYFKLLPYYIFAAGLAIMLNAIMGCDISLGSFLKNNVWELFMLEGFGITDGLIVGPGWFCSSLLIAGCAVYFLLSKNRAFYINLIAPFALMVTFVYMYHHFGNLNRWLQVDTIISTGTLRGFAELGLGCICFEIVSAVKPKIRRRFMVCSALIEIIAIAFVMCVIYSAEMDGYDFVCVLIMALAIVSFSLGNSILSSLLNNSFSVYLGKISVSIYLNHVVLAKINWFQLLSWSWTQSFFAYLGITIVFSCLSTEVVNSIVRYIRDRKEGKDIVR